MKNIERSNSKDDLLRIRIRKDEKEKYVEEAKKLKMTLSQYVLYTMRNQNIEPIVGAQELARQIYATNQALSKIEKDLETPTQNLRDTMTEAIKAVRSLTSKIK